MVVCSSLVMGQDVATAPLPVHVSRNSYLADANSLAIGLRVYPGCCFPHARGAAVWHVLVKCGVHSSGSDTELVAEDALRNLPRSLDASLAAMWELWLGMQPSSSFPICWPIGVEKRRLRVVSLSQGWQMQASSLSHTRTHAHARTVPRQECRLVSFV